jgi:rhodanese-related sulfurtransferase
METPLEVDVVTAAALHREGAMLLDVREPFEVEQVCVARSERIPMRQIPERVAELPRDRDILVLCHHGGRSMRVAMFLRAQGFSRATNVAGGIDAWAVDVDPSLPRY